MNIYKKITLSLVLGFFLWIGYWVYKINTEPGGYENFPYVVYLLGGSVLIIIFTCISAMVMIKKDK